jgi:uncharacterized membrane protein YbhN (UPF0104 family)
LKVGISVLLLGYLGYKAATDESFHKLVAGPKDWLSLAGAALITLLAVTLTIWRWRILVRTLGIPFAALDAFRFGFIGYLFNLMPFGVVGGDGLKAAFLIHLQPERKTEAIASVVIDRTIGLGALITLAAGASLFLHFDRLNFRGPEDRLIVEQLCHVTQVLALITLAGLGLLLAPGFTQSKLWDALEHIPVVGKVLYKLVEAMRLYRRRVDRLAIVFAMSFAIHALYAMMVYLVGAGLQSPRPALGTHFVFVPLSMAAGALPIGTLEGVLDLLYRVFSNATIPEGQGFAIALAYRIIQVLVAGIGVAFYFTGRKEVKELIHEAEEATEEESLIAAPE